MSGTHTPDGLTTSAAAKELLDCLKARLNDIE